MPRPDPRSPVDDDFYHRDPTGDTHQGGGPRPSPPDDLPPDDDDYELEAPDPHIQNRARRQAAQDLDDAREGLEIDLATRAMSERNLEDADFEFKFRFQVKHLLIATTITSLLLAARELLNADSIAVLVVLLFLALAGAYWYVSKEEEKQFQAAYARRAAAVRRMRERQAALSRGEEPPTVYDEQLPEDATEPPAAPPRFLPSYSLLDVMIAVTVASAIMGLGAAVGFNALSVLLGLVAIGGLACYGFGVPTPPRVVTVWWVTMAFYILVCLARIFGAT